MFEQQPLEVLWDDLIPIDLDQTAERRRAVQLAGLGRELGGLALDHLADVIAGCNRRPVARRLAAEPTQWAGHLICCHLLLHRLRWFDAAATGSDHGRPLARALSGEAGTQVAPDQALFD